MRPANTDAPDRGDIAIDPRPPVDYVEPYGPSPITNPILTPEVRALEPTPNCFQTSGVETRPARRSIAFFSNIDIDKRLRGGDHANGLHAVIARQANGIPQGQQNPWPVAQKSTLFRTPDSWDAGNVRATPGSGA